MSNESDPVETTDEKGVVVTYYDEPEVVEMKQFSYYTGLLVGFCISSLLWFLFVMVL